MKPSRKDLSLHHVQLDKRQREHLLTETNVAMSTGLTRDEERQRPSVLMYEEGGATSEQ